MKKISGSLFGITIITAAVSSWGGSQPLLLIVENPSSAERRQEPVVVPWNELAVRFADPFPLDLRLLDRNGRSLAFQLEDLDGDGTPDELAFLADFRGRDERTYSLVLSDTPASPIGPLRTDAGNWKRIGNAPRPVDDDDGPGLLRHQSSYVFDGVGWESELIGYRLYLDERNAIDIQGKRIPGLHWNFIGSSGVNYQSDAFWGMDVLHVGPSLGFGGVALWDGDSVIKPERLQRRRCRILSRGPVRTVVRVDYEGWETPSGPVHLTSFFLQYAGNRATEHRLVLRSPGQAEVVLGVVRHEQSVVSWDPSEASLISFGRQSRAGDRLLMMIAVDPSSVIRRTANASDDLIVLRAVSDQPLRIRMLSAWEGEEGFSATPAEVTAFRQTLVRRIKEPIRVRTREYPSK